ncbi:BnaC04g26980D [Brassica napus]|uniref:BnaC04g26980D protein n=2 Tax=Brassica napus TaxID=3708 RepID=A0A078H1Y8_BRANA|nr:BnaC04g26980D [Brassica napus]
MLDCSFEAYQTPVVPGAYISPRGRSKKLMKKHRSKFEVLAQVAGKYSGDSKA